jgi:hypothetical protein
MLNQTRGTIQDVASNIRAREFPIKPGHICKTCEYRFLCPSQETRRGPLLDADEEPQPPRPAAKKPATIKQFSTVKTK